MTDACNIVFTCDPAQACLSKDLCADLLSPYNIKAQMTQLGRQKAYNIEVTAEQVAKIDLAKLTAKADLRRVDVNFVSHAYRRKKLLVADMESTIIEQECLDELAEQFGLRSQIGAITERAMRGDIKFEAALKERVGALKGLPESMLEKIYLEKVTLMSGAKTLIATMKAHGAVCALVSGGFSYYAEKIATRLEFDRWRSNTLIIKKGVVDGTVSEPILDGNAKAGFLKAWQKEMGLPQEATLAVGDGSNDLAMIKIAGLGVAFHAKPLLARAAKININYGDLTALLYLQGYKEQDFISVSRRPRP